MFWPGISFIGSIISANIAFTAEFFTQKVPVLSTDKIPNYFFKNSTKYQNRLNIFCQVPVPIPLPTVLSKYRLTFSAWTQTITSQGNFYLYTGNPKSSSSISGMFSWLRPVALHLLSFSDDYLAWQWSNQRPLPFLLYWLLRS